MFCPGRGSPSARSLSVEPSEEDDNSAEWTQQFLTRKNNKRVEFWAHKTRRVVHKHMTNFRYYHFYYYSKPGSCNSKLYDLELCLI